MSQLSKIIVTILSLRDPIPTVTLKTDCISFAISKPITYLSLQCFFLGPLCDGYWQERGGRQNLPSLCRCCGQITIWSTWSFVRSKWPALESISSASLSPDFDRWQVSRWAVIVSWHSCTFISWEKPRELPHVIFLLSLKLHDSKFMLKLFLLNEICVRAHFATKWLWYK